MQHGAHMECRILWALLYVLKVRLGSRMVTCTYVVHQHTHNTYVLPSWFVAWSSHELSFSKLYTYAYAYTYICIYIHIVICLLTFIYICIHICVCMYYMYLCICLHQLSTLFKSLKVHSPSQLVTCVLPLHDANVVFPYTCITYITFTWIHVFFSSCFLNTYMW